MRRLCLGILTVFCGCAERDNPWDPVNRMAESGATQLPVPGPGVKVVLPDSASRDPANPYFANIQSALRSVEAGDTLWIQGGKTYSLGTGLELVLGGAAYHWVVVRSFGGEVRLVEARPGTISSLLTVTGPGYVELRGLAFVQGSGAGFRANGLQGPLRLDSCRFDSNGTYGLETRGLRNSLVLRSLRMKGNVNSPPMSVETVVDSVDVRFE